MFTGPTARPGDPPPGAVEVAEPPLQAIWHSSAGFIPMPNPFVRRLKQVIDLTASESDALQALLHGRIRQYEPGAEIAGQGQPADGVSVFLAGWSTRAKVLADGRRQIIAFVLPGDICGFGNSVVRTTDHAIGALSTVTLADLDPSQLGALMTEHTRLRRALRWDRAVGAAIQREWTVNLGCRTAFERFAHLFCELLHRLRAVGLAEGDRFQLPATQTDLADAMGVSTVHANRVLQELRQSGLIRLQGGAVELPDVGRLSRLALFDPTYLHLDGWRQTGVDDAALV